MRHVDKSSCCATRLFQKAIVTSFTDTQHDMSLLFHEYILTRSLLSYLLFLKLVNIYVAVCKWCTIICTNMGKIYSFVSFHIYFFVFKYH